MLNGVTWKQLFKKKIVKLDSVNFFYNLRWFISLSHILSTCKYKLSSSCNHFFVKYKLNIKVQWNGIKTKKFKTFNDNFPSNTLKLSMITCTSVFCQQIIFFFLSNCQQILHRPARVWRDRFCGTQLYLGLGPFDSGLNPLVLYRPKVKITKSKMSLFHFFIFFHKKRKIKIH